MRFCENCGAKLQDDELFCSECGTKVESEVQPNKKNTYNRQREKSGNTKKQSSGKKFEAKDIAFIVFVVVLVLVIAGGAYYLLVFRDKPIDTNNNTAENVTANTTNATTDTSNKTQAIDPSEYLLPDSDKRIISTDELQKLSAADVRLACNELYARHGRKFNDPQIQEYFNSKSWYHGTIEPDAFDENVFNGFEKQNKDIIVNYETVIGSNNNGNSGGYTNQQLIDMARRYANNHGGNPSNVEVEGESGDNVTIHLYSDGADFTYTYDWYTINRKTGEGTNNMGQYIKL